MYPYDAGRDCPNCAKRPVVRVHPLGNLYRCESCRTLWLRWEGRLFHPSVGTVQKARQRIAEEKAAAEREWRDELQAALEASFNKSEG